MYVHIGQSKVINSRDIIGIFDLEVTSQSHITREFLSRAEKDGCVEANIENLPRSFIVCENLSAPEEGGKVHMEHTAFHEHKVFLSQLSSQTMAKRCR